MPLNRRDFINRSAATGAGVALAGTAATVAAASPAQAAEEPDHGAAIGGLFGAGVDRLIPGAHLSPGACALVAMAAVFGSASRATFTFIVFAFEIVHDYNAVLPLMLVYTITAYAVFKGKVRADAEYH